jgi:PAS domain S-box-containing protein
MEPTPFVLLNAAAAAMALAVAALAWNRRRVPGGRPLAFLMGAVALWAAGAALELHARGLDAKLFFARLQYVGTVSVPPLFLIFALDYCRLQPWIRPRTVALLFLVPCATLVLAMTNPRHGLIWSRLVPDPEGPNLVIYEHGVWFWIGGVGYSYLMAAAAALLLARGALRSHRLYRRQTSAIFAGATFPWLASALYNAGWIPFPGLDPTPMAFVFSGLVSSFAIFRLGFLDLVPVARNLLVETMGDGVMVVDLQGRLIDINPAACRMLGVALDGGLPGEPLEKVRSSRPGILRRIAAVREGRFETVQDGSWLEISASPLRDWPDQDYGRLVLIRDVSERKRNEQERLELERQALNAQKIESIGVLAGGIAHDFNNLLMIVQGSIEMTLLDTPPDSPARTLLEQGMGAAERAAELTRQILDYSGRGRSVTADVDLNAVAAEKVSLLRAAAPKEVRLELKAADRLPVIRADAAQIGQLLVNLIENAVEAIGPQAGVVTVATGLSDCDRFSLEHSLTEEKPEAGRFVHLEVSDTGSGMPAEVRRRIFEPFFSTRATGRGLGLAAVQGIVRGCRGALFVDSAPGKGTVIRALFPVASAARTAAVGGFPPVAPSAALARRRRLLVVEDEEAVRELCRRMLDRMGYEVLTAADGLEGAALFRRRSAEIDGVILDGAMPRMSGLDALREMLRVRPELRAVLASGFPEKDAAERFGHAGLSGFIQKPYRFDALKELAGRVFGAPAGAPA